jgi:hypothetical protein
LEEQQPWSAQRRIGFAAMDRESLNGVLGVWAEKPGRSVSEVRCTLEAGVP